LPIKNLIQPILAHGHRGARALRPENTIAGFEYAIGTGVDALELDVAVTRDDVVVVSHDPDLNPKLCQGPGAPVPIRTLLLRDLRQWDCGSLRNPAFPRQEPIPGARIPTLDEVLALAPLGAFDFNIETKIFADRPEYTPSPETFAQLVLDCVRRHRLETRAVVLSFDFRTLHAMQALAPEMRLSALYEDGADDFTSIATRAGARIVSPEKSLVTPEKVKAAHVAGLQVVAWTANTQADWYTLAGAGVDAIVSDDPAALIAWLAERKLR
jgi:glycerophosphoryl diester phosphodiesterase